MFRNKVLVRAAASTSSSAPLPPFLLRQLSLPAVVPIPALDLEILCSRLSRRYRLACLPQAPADKLLVYQRCQSHEAAVAVSEVMAAFPGASVSAASYHVGEVEELACSGELVAKAVGCELRSLMLEHGWRCLGETIFVCSTFAESEERTDLCAVNVNVRLGGNDDFEFVVSPDAFRFAAHKGIVRYSPQNNAWISSWSFAHLRLPSSLVLQGSGLQPALKSARASKAMSSLGSFAKLLNAWNFFGQNQLEIKSADLEPSSSILYFYAAQATPFKPSFSRKKPAGKRKLRYSLEHADVDNSNKSSHLDAATSLSNSVSSSSASLFMQVTQERQDCKETQDSFDKDFIPGISEVKKAIPDIENDMLSAKVRDDQNDELNRKVRKAKTRPVNKDLCNSTRTKAETGIANDEFMAKFSSDD
ncbi:hypothetical protein PR202_gb03430 [Eleusine coracana subsp. coracana]|uniref:Uncharacterized protein n=1 Tax=Eleusine coracana subsp. coracana TaxID=191504 RepID=A0AAV5E165_ELECO|nr:hypothetical protein PR202_gb03430 [Eleusine coracana subsp. coracana]